MGVRLQRVKKKLFTLVICSTLLLVGCDLNEITKVGEKDISSFGMREEVNRVKEENTTKYYNWLKSELTRLEKEGKLKTDDYLLANAQLISYGVHSINGGHIMMDYYDLAESKPYSSICDKRKVHLSDFSLLNSEQTDSLDLETVIDITTISTLKDENKPLHLPKGIEKIIDDAKISNSKDESAVAYVPKDFDYTLLYDYLSSKAYNSNVYSKSVEIISTDELLVVPTEFVNLVNTPLITGVLLYNIVR